MAKEVVKKTVVEFTDDEMSKIKLDLRESLKALDIKKITALCKTHKVDTSKYKNLTGGLLRMNYVNSLIGVAARGLRSGQFTKSNVKKSFS